MLTELKLRNFLSYESETIRFPENATIAVVGDNGHGKSGLLEAIRFALFGDGRGDLKDLIRLGSDGEMQVSLKMSGVPSSKKTMVVERGVHKSGTGYTRVYINDALVAKGGAKPSNNAAQDLINSAVGSDGDLFTLTAFFGLGTGDSLMQARPAERLETLQKVAGIDICSSFHSKALEKEKECQQSISEETRALEVLSSKVKDPKEIQEAITTASEKLKDSRQSLEDKMATRNSYLKDQDRFQGLLREREGVQHSLLEMKKQKTRDEERYWTASKKKERLAEESSTLNPRIKAVEKNINADQDSLDDLTAAIEKKLSQRGMLRGKMSVKQSALEIDSEECPLCEGVVDKHIHDVWREDIAKLTKKIETLESEITALKDRKKAKSIAQDTLSTLKQKQLKISGEGESLDTALRESKSDMDRISAEIEKLEGRLSRIEAQVSGYTETLRKVKAIDAEISNLHTLIGSYEQSIDNLKRGFKENQELRKDLSGMKEKIEAYEKSARSYRIVAEAFSRYAIPVQLLRNLRTALESRASTIYRQFANGSIKIADVEGARPGVEFVLIDEMGERPYKSLSIGERVMMYLSIRVALTQIINAGRDHKIDFLILDEVAGNLDPSKRVSLTRLINALLRKHFPQVFLVSHVELRDIFNQTLYVKKTDGVSHVN